MIGFRHVTWKSEADSPKYKKTMPIKKGLNPRPWFSIFHEVSSDDEEARQKNRMGV
jgi:hypothetical protein